MILNVIELLIVFKREFTGIFLGIVDIVVNKTIKISGLLSCTGIQPENLNMVDPSTS